MIEELEENALEQLKRADQLLYVTLKYVRTADVIKNTIKRLINAYDCAVLSGLAILDLKPDVIRRNRIIQLSKKFKIVKSDIKFYLMLRQIDQASFTRKEEYRKNVALITRFGEVNIVVLTEYFNRTKEFVLNVNELIEKHRLLLGKRERRAKREKKVKRKKRK